MKNAFWVIVILAVLGAAWLLFGNNNPDREETKSEQSESQTNPPPANSSAETKNDEQASEDVWVGVLKLSNDKSRGNIMLEVEDSDRIIYINTSRDFSSLYNKTVEVSYEGDLNGFRLIDITAE